MKRKALGPTVEGAGCSVSGTWPCELCGGASRRMAGAGHLRPSSRCPGLAHCPSSREGFWGQMQVESGVPGGIPPFLEDRVGQTVPSPSEISGHCPERCPGLHVGDATSLPALKVHKRRARGTDCPVLPLTRGTAERGEVWAGRQAGQGAGGGRGDGF